MVTASHNPKEDNGFKVYWGNGAMVSRPSSHATDDVLVTHPHTLTHSLTHSLTSLMFADHSTRVHSHVRVHFAQS